MLFIQEIFKGEKLPYPYQTQIINGHKFWYTNINKVNEIYYLQHCYRSDEELEIQRLEWEKNKLIEQKKKQYENFLFHRKYTLIRDIDLYFIRKNIKKELLEIEIQRSIRRKLKKENYKIKYGYRHTKNILKKKK